MCDPYSLYVTRWRGIQQCLGALSLTSFFPHLTLPFPHLPSLLPIHPSPISPHLTSPLQIWVRQLPSSWSPNFEQTFSPIIDCRFCPKMSSLLQHSTILLLQIYFVHLFGKNLLLFWRLRGIFNHKQDGHIKVALLPCTFTPPYCCISSLLYHFCDVIFKSKSCTSSGSFTTS